MSYKNKTKSGGKTEISINNQRFGNLLAIERIYDNSCYSNGRFKIKYKCLCDCGEYLEVFKNNLIMGYTKSCGCLRKRTRRTTWKGYEEISGRLIGRIKHGAKIRNLEYNISNEFLWNLFLKQDRKCVITGYDINFAESYASEVISQTASLDRIDSSKGYVEGNVQWVHKDVNRLKSDWTLEKFHKLCEDITNYKNSNK
jgi:hypothetical protein